MINGLPKKKKKSGGNFLKIHVIKWRNNMKLWLQVKNSKVEIKGQCLSEVSYEFY